MLPSSDYNPSLFTHDRSGAGRQAAGRQSKSAFHPGGHTTEASILIRGGMGSASAVLNAFTVIKTGGFCLFRGLNVQRAVAVCAKTVMSPSQKTFLLILSSTLSTQVASNL